MNAPPVVRVARADETGAVARVLTDAFVDEAGLNYWLRQGAAKEQARARFFDKAVRDGVHPRRALWIAEANGAPAGAAIWLAPGCKAYDFTLLQQIAMAPLLLSIAGTGGTSRGFALADQLEALHPQRPHAHLAYLGVASAAQGQGVGSAILKATLAPLDAQGVLAYLETSTGRNVALYQRHGFVVTGEIKLPNLHMWTMTRQPRG
jgi:ribosomal protein S18 acetylase RimI-like enzyme